MRILALETSAKAVSAAVTEDGKVLCSGYQDTGLTHSRTLMPIVEAMLKNTGLTVQDCDAVAVAAGPGSFTGIRIGVSAAKGLAFAADKPCAAVSTLEAMARNVAHMDALVVCAMDARRSQIYNALFTSEHGRLTRRTPDRAIGLAELAEELRSEPLPLVIVGDGAVICYVQDLVIRPELQGSGLGSELLQRLIAHVKSLGFPDTTMMLALMCAKGREEFYIKNGFTPRPTPDLGPGMITYLSL